MQVATSNSASIREQWQHIWKQQRPEELGHQQIRDYGRRIPHIEISSLGGLLTKAKNFGKLPGPDIFPLFQ